MLLRRRQRNYQAALGESREPWKRRILADITKANEDTKDIENDEGAESEDYQPEDVLDA